MAKDSDDFAEKIARRAAQRARRRSHRSSIWFGVGTFGIVGWSIAIPTLLGLALGVWLDRNVDTDHSWTVSLLLAGITLGCLNAWYWVAEQRIVDEDGEAEDD